MPRWVVILIVGSLAVCVTCGSLGYVFWKRAGSAVSSEMAEIVATSVVASIGTNDLPSGQLVLTEDDLNVNNALALNGSCGFEMTNRGTQIYGVTTQITPAGITFDCGGGGYSTMPVIEAGRVELTEIEASNDAVKFILSKDKFEKGMEQGINSAFEAKGLTPIAITLTDGMLLILTESAVS